jgi:Uma2 family endonuclease
MARSLRWTTADLEALPDRLDGTRYEIIDGELHVSRQPGLDHQLVCGNVYGALRYWSDRTGAGYTIFAPGVIFASDDNVAPDLVWISQARLAAALWPDRRHLHAAPDLIVEVLSPGPENEQRDREAKLKLYSRRGVHGYWIVDLLQRRVEVHRREEAELRLAGTLHASDVLRSPLLPDFALPVSELFAGLP